MIYHCFGFGIHFEKFYMYIFLYIHKINNNIYYNFTIGSSIYIYIIYNLLGLLLLVVAAAVLVITTISKIIIHIIKSIL